MKKIIALIALAYRSISVLINRQLGTWQVLTRLFRSICRTRATSRSSRSPVF